MRRPSARRAADSDTVGRAGAQACEASAGQRWRRGVNGEGSRPISPEPLGFEARELALRVLKAKGLDEGDKVLRQAVAFRIVQAFGMAAKRGAIGNAGKRKGVKIWHL